MPRQKRLFDILFASALLVVLGPIILCVAVVLKLRQGGAVFYIARRMRSVDESFGLIKFRTMAPDPLDQGVSGGEKAGRVTPMGRWMRRYRVDELPQIFNILRGDISFVGPRPPLPSIVARFEDVYAEVLRARPGVTGLATVVFHRHEEWLLSGSTSAAQTDLIYVRRCIARKAHLDRIYRDNWSLSLDIWLILRTALPGRLRARGFRSKPWRTTGRAFGAAEACKTATQTPHVLSES